MKKPYVSVIVPAYNEEEIIKKTLQTITKFLKTKNYKWEIVLVDDGSQDNTVKIVKKLKTSNLRLYVHKKNKGKGGALRTGFKHANGKYILFTDVDQSVHIRYLDDLLKELESGADVVICSRRVEGAKIVVHQPLARELMGRGYVLFARMVLLSPITDFTCGFKAFESKAGKRLFNKGVLDRWVYDSEILFLASKFGYSVKQVPVEWRNRLDSRVQVGSAVYTSFIDLLKIRVNDFLKKYD